MTQQPICTTCPYCGTGCGVLASIDGAVGLKVKGDPDHPANFGRLCSKGSALGETIIPDGRLHTPQINGQPASWDAALDMVADAFSTTIAKHGPDSVAFYVSGQLLTEDYYVANKLMKGYIGSANIDTNSRLCMASTVAGQKRAFGTDTVPGTYEDLELADLVVLTGSNLAWCHPVLYQRIVAAKAARPSMKVVVIDPRRTATCDLADMHLALKPGTDVALFNHLLNQINDLGAVDAQFVSAHVSGFADALDVASATDGSVTGLTDSELAAFAALWIGTEKTVTVFSQGINQSDHGADKVNAILNCHLATGRIGKPGCGPFSVTGQPNAMGGREVGGLANMLAAHLDIENATHRDAVQTFWSSPTMAKHQGLKAVDMFQAISEGKIKALWVMCTNPVVSLPDADAVKSAIAGCDFVAVSDLSATTDTAVLADVVLPATGWGEKDGTVTNSDRTISRQRALMSPTGQSRHDWEIISDVARRMGYEGFDYETPAQIFREHAQLSGVAANQGKDFDISGLAGISDADFEALQPTRWPVRANGAKSDRFFADGGFFTPTKRANMLPVLQPAPKEQPAALPYRLNTGRIRDQWHTMTRTALAPRLNQHYGEPFLELHPEDALALGLRPADLALVESLYGTTILRVLVTDRVAPGSVFAPIHWTGETSSAGRVSVLVPPSTDPTSGQPDSKAAPVAIKPYAAEWYGFAACETDFTPSTEYWAKARSTTGWRVELADKSAPDDWQEYARALFGINDAQISSVTDPARNIARVALHKSGKLIAALYAASTPVSVSRNFASELIGTDGHGALAGQAGANQPDPGATVCACFNVGVNTILSAIESDKLMSVDAIGQALSAGTNCGSCKPELAAILNSALSRAAAE
ncbi:assimilatory nitrate reductase catalytic subunit [Shimia isoporae]|uniref:Assimilatory nitrate reductase catalytic subunit n=1 Tax=Shimia isoporae TaxID=647720 RepID=A0A4R1N259_9RHOB|nr:nitrate reductase [Shimia isoporae]TCL00451.1 assimilatory nitrate reductase catalytic subunit [Shimia isoporae]